LLQAFEAIAEELVLIFKVLKQFEGCYQVKRCSKKCQFMGIAENKVASNIFRITAEIKPRYVTAASNVPKMRE
jgi:hypothetical protein